MGTSVDIGSFVTCSADIANGRPMIAGTRTSVNRIVILYKQGSAAEDIARRLSHLTLAQVYAALAYYHANRDDIEADLAQADADYWQLAERHTHRQPSSNS